MRMTSAPPASPEKSAIQPAFDHHEAAVAFRGGPDPVDGFGGDSHRRIETESHIGGEEVVVDGFWNANRREAFLKKPMGDLQCPIASDGDEPIQPGFSEIGHHGFRNIHGPPLTVDGHHELKRIVPVRASQNGSAILQKMAHFRRIQLGELIVNQTAESVLNTLDADSLPLRR